MTPAQVRSYYERGEDLRRGRGVHQRELVPRGAAREEVRDRMSQGMGRTEDDEYLARWRRRTAPGWIPRNRSAMGDDVAAILSWLPAPRNWAHVEARQEDGMWRITVYLKVGYPREVLLPDRQAMEEFGRLVNQYGRRSMAASPREQQRLDDYWDDADGDAWEFEFDVYGS
jgi:hypothetical protein